MEENRRIGIYISYEVEEYIEGVKKELKPVYGRVSMGMAVSEIVRRNQELIRKNQELQKELERLKK